MELLKNIKNVSFENLSEIEIQHNANSKYIYVTYINLDGIIQEYKIDELIFDKQDSLNKIKVVFTEVLSGRVQVYASRINFANALSPVERVVLTNKYISFDNKYITSDDLDAYVLYEDFIEHSSNYSNPHQITTSKIGAINTSSIGANNGVAPLGPDGKILSQYIPSELRPKIYFVDGYDELNNLSNINEGDEAFDKDSGSSWIYDGYGWYERPSEDGVVICESSSVDNSVARFDGITGSIIQDSNVFIDDNGKLSTKELNVANGSPGETGYIDFKVLDIGGDDFNLGLSTNDQGRIFASCQDGTYRQAMVFSADGFQNNTIFGVGSSNNGGSSWNPRFVVRQNGQVGINKKVPEEALDVVGNINLTGVINGVDVESHKLRHEASGDDEINVSGLSGLLNDIQKIEVQKDGVKVGEKTKLNFISGSNIDIEALNSDGVINVTISGENNIGVHGNTYHDPPMITVGGNRSDSAIDGLLSGSNADDKHTHDTSIHGSDKHSIVYLTQDNNRNDSNLDTLVNGSVADSLHSHSVVAAHGSDAHTVDYITVGGNRTDSGLEGLLDGSNADNKHIHSVVEHGNESHSVGFLTAGNERNDDNLDILTDYGKADSLHYHDNVSSHGNESHSVNMITVGGNRSDSNLDTLVNGSVADSLHSHSVVAAHGSDAHTVDYITVGGNRTDSGLEGLLDGSNADEKHIHNNVAQHNNNSHSVNFLTEGGNRSDSNLNTLVNGSVADSLHSHNVVAAHGSDAHAVDYITVGGNRSNSSIEGLLDGSSADGKHTHSGFDLTSRVLFFDDFFAEAVNRDTWKWVRSGGESSVYLENDWAGGWLAIRSDDDSGKYAYVSFNNNSIVKNKDCVVEFRVRREESGICYLGLYSTNGNDNIVFKAVDDGNWITMSNDLETIENDSGIRANGINKLKIVWNDDGVFYYIDDVFIASHENTERIPNEKMEPLMYQYSNNNEYGYLYVDYVKIDCGREL